MPASNAPETPRQRLIGLMYILLLCMLALNVSSDVLYGFDLVEDSLSRSTENSHAQNRSLYNEFEAYYASNPEKTEAWYQLAQELQQRSDAIYQLIDSLKWAVVREADGKKADINNVKRTDNLDAAANIMLPPSGKKGKALKQAIEEYRNHIMEMVNDSLKRKVIQDNFSTTPPEKARKQGQDWETAMFENMPVGAVLTMFTKLQNDIRYAEGEVLHILTNNIDVGDFRVNQIKAYVIPNAENIVRGGVYRANIILSAEDSTQRPEIMVNGSTLAADKNGMYEVTTSRSGVFPVEGFIEMKRGDGSTQRLPFAQQYTVVEPMATVSNTMMNVLYAGIDNKISISVPGITNQQISATSNNGSLSPSGQHWIAKPTNIGKECIITVTANVDGRRQVVSNTPFRVRPLPEPRAFIEYKDNNGITRRYKGGSGFSKALLLDAPGITAALDDDLLDVSFNVLSFQTLIYDSMGNTLMEVSQGGRFSDRQILQIRGLSRGKRLWISNIRAVGPDRVEQSLAPMEIIIN
ncbi:MAG: gliding motility protein GldM [Bacteroidales bacterium]|nr:gliding motility protein GldM [Bacteroidales bacterium]